MLFWLRKGKGKQKLKQLSSYPASCQSNSSFLDLPFKIGASSKCCMSSTRFLAFLLLLISNFSPLAFAQANLKEQQQQPTADTPSVDKAQFLLHPAKLDALFHRAATMALLKAKARETLLAVSEQMERILFRECTRDAHSPAKYARCLVKLFRARDNAKKAKDAEAEMAVQRPRSAEGILGGTMSWLAELAKGWGSKVPMLQKVPTLLLPKGPRQVKSSNKAGKKTKPKLLVVAEERKATKRKQQQKMPKKWHKKWQPPFLSRRAKWARRTRRALEEANGQREVGGEKLLPKNIRALRQLQRYMDRLDWAQNFLRGMSQQSAGALKPFLGGQPIRFVPPLSPALSLLAQLQQILNGTAGTRSDLSLSLLSPRLLSLFPTAKNKARLLSPDLFSFTRDGFMPLPQLFRMVSGDERESLKWLDFVLDLTGAGKQLESLVERMRPEMEQFEQRTWPAVEKLRTQEEQWEQLRASLSRRQRGQLKRKGVVPLEQWQQEMLLGEQKAGEASRLGLEAKIAQLAQLADLPEAEVKRRIRREAEGAVKEEEMDAQHVQELNEEQPEEENAEINGRAERKKRGHHDDDDDDSDEDDDDDNDSDEYKKKSLRYLPPYSFTTTTTQDTPSTSIGSIIVMGNDSAGDTFGVFGGPSPDTENNFTVVPRTVLLTPWAFNQRLGGVILEGVYLSPHVFSSELVSPEVLTLKVASPSAFMAAILSPMALTARIISPTAFRAQILSPEALSAYVLSPDVFLAEVLSPNVMQARVMSAKVLFVQVLSPMIASPQLGSPRIGGLVVMSPNFLSPRIYSRESLLVEVLSPHVLGGEHDFTEDDRWTPDGSTHYVGNGPVDLGTALLGG